MLKNEGILKFAFRICKEYFLIILGILSTGFGLKGFLIPNGFIDGGITGISLLFHFLTAIPLSLLIFIINLPFIFLARKQIGEHFALKTFIAVLVLSFSLLVIDYPTITSDKFLVSIFGGFFLGAGIGLSMRGGCVLDGTEVLSVYLSRKINLTIGEVIFLINLVIFSFAAIFLSIESALYSILIYLSASKTIDFIVVGIEEYTGITIISEKDEEIRRRINGLGKGITIYKGKKGFSEEKGGKEINILFTVVTRLETYKIKNEIISIDPSAVIIEHSIKEARGGIIKKRPLH